MCIRDSPGLNQVGNKRCCIAAAVVFDQNAGPDGAGGVNYLLEAGLKPFAVELLSLIHI